MSTTKISWGTGIVIAFIAFISFILYFVINMTINSRSNHDLVTPDYYQKELHFQEDLAAQQRAKALEKKVVILATQEGLLIEFPLDMTTTAATVHGKLSLSKPNNKNLDQEVPLQLQENYMLIPASQLVGGRWNVVLEWEFQEQTYRIEQGIQMPLNTY